MRVLHLTPTWDVTVGGTGKVAYNLSRELNKTRHFVSSALVFNESGSDSNAVYISSTGFAGLIKAIIWLIILKPDIIHCHGRIYYVFAGVIYRAFRFASVKLLVSFYTQPVIYDYFSKCVATYNFKDRARRLIGNIVLRYVDSIVANSESLALNISNYYRLKDLPVSVVYSGVEAVKGVDNKKRIKKLTANKFVFLTVGVLQWDWKVVGVLDLVESFHKYKKSLTNCVLVIVGDGAYYDLVSSKIKDFGIDNVYMLGNVKSTYSILSDADVYCHMAYNESSSVSILEAMNYGVPVIVSACGGNPELVEENITGWVVKPTHESIGAALIESLHNKPAREKYKQAALERVRNNFTWPNITKKYINIYDKGLKNKYQK